jgi:GH43 family beta-xylosidase
MLSRSVCWTALVLGHIVSLAAVAGAAETDDVLLFSFFRGNGEAGTYLASSDDGLGFRPLNDDKPVFAPPDWPGQNLTRDPSIVYHDGTFHAVWTTSWQGRCFAYARSADLARWSAPVRVEPFSAALPQLDQPHNIWAPEIHWDPVQKNFAIVFSATTERESTDGDGSNNNGKDGQDHRLYITRTADGKTFSDARTFFDQGFSVIDGQMVFDRREEGDRWLMFVKHEKEVALGGKNLRLTEAPGDFGRPWSPVSEPVLGPGAPLRSGEMVEGPTLLRWNGQWRLYADAFADRHYSLITSSDLKTWTDRTADLVMPPNRPRHGTVFRAPRAAVAFLK